MAHFCYCNGWYHCVRSSQSGVRYGETDEFSVLCTSFLLPIIRSTSAKSVHSHTIRMALVDMTLSAIEKLNEGQRDCLRLVLAHHNSKEIARELGVSPHTVDQRLRTAMRVLGVQSRFEAARKFAVHDENDQYQSLIYQVSDVERGRKNGKPDASTERSISNCKGSINIIDDPKVDGNSVGTAFGKTQIGRRWLPIPQHRGEKNSLGTVERLGWILAIAIASALSFGGLIAGLEALSRLKG